MTDPRVSVVIPAFDEAEQIVPVLDRILEGLTLPCEILVVYDSASDTTVPYLEKYARVEPRVVPVLNTDAPGPGNAIRFGVREARADVVVVTMADGSDDPHQIRSTC